MKSKKFARCLTMGLWAMALLPGWLEKPLLLLGRLHGFPCPAVLDSSWSSLLDWTPAVTWMVEVQPPFLSRKILGPCLDAKRF